jgi:glutamate/tyrosine decarboxylase-like PLP-dependent enzyme
VIVSVSGKKNAKPLARASTNRGMHKSYALLFGLTLFSSPNIVMGANAQVALEKMARYFDVECRFVIGRDFFASL